MHYRVQGVKLQEHFGICSYRKHVFMGKKSLKEGGNRKKLHLTRSIWVDLQMSKSYFEDRVLEAQFKIHYFIRFQDI